MPLYEFECAECGPFTKLRSLNQSSAPAECPECGATAPRVFSVIKLNANRTM